MKKTVNANTDKTVVDALKSLKDTGKILDRKLYKNFYNDLKEVHKTCYKVFCARQKGDFSLDSKAMTEVTNFLHTLGKANGKFISVCEKVSNENENGKEQNANVLFDMLVYRSFKYQLRITGKTLAHLECEKKKASEEKNKAHKDLIDGKGTAKAYKEALAKYNEAVATFEEEKEKDGNKRQDTTKENDGTFAKFVVNTLIAIVDKRYAKTLEEIETERKLHNKENKEKRSKAKPEAKKQSPKKTTEKAKKPEAVTSPKEEKKIA